MKVNQCVSFLLINNHRVLLEHRSKDKASDPGLIAIPGGHCDPGEGQLDTLSREMQEELMLTPLSSVFLCSLYHPGSSELQLIHYYLVMSWQGEIQAIEADEVAWYDIHHAPLDLPADRSALAEYIRLSNVGEERFDLFSLDSAHT